jgi:hypothetical protein
MVFEFAVNIQTLIPWAILVAGIIYETTMFIYRKIAGGEQFSLEKYALTYGYVALLAVIAYLTTGIIPGVDQIMIQLQEIPDYATILPLIFAVIMGVFQQGSRTIQAKKTVAATTTITPIAAGSTGTEQGGRAKVAGIYGGSAAGNVPQQSLTFNINQVPNLFFDLIGITTGVIALKMDIDGKTMVKWMPDIISVDGGVFNAVVNKVGERMPFGFNLWNAGYVPGTHIITIYTGQFDEVGKNPKWLTTDNFAITLTGTPPLE